METNYKLPKFNRKEKVAGVYKITFDGAHFYIGGSINIRTRFIQWKTKLRLGINKNKQMRELAKTAIEIVLEILEPVEITQYSKDREDFYIKKHWNDPLLLNKCPNANNNIGLRFTKDDLKNRKRATVFAKPIAMFDLDWNFIKKFDFIADAKRELGVNVRSGISDFLNGKSQYIKGRKFKLIAKDGSYIEPAPFVSKKKPLKPKRIPQPNTPSKEIIQFDTDGKEVKRFPSIWKAATYLNADRKNFTKVINGKKSKTGYYKGFIYRYA